MMKDGRFRLEYAEIVMNRGFGLEDHNAVASCLSNFDTNQYSTLNPK